MINAPLKRSLHCVLNGGTAVKIVRQIAEMYAQTWRRSKCGLSKTKSSRSWAVEKLQSAFFFQSKAWFPCRKLTPLKLSKQQVEAAPSAADAAATWLIASGCFAQLRTIVLKSYLVRFSKTTHPRLEENKTFPTIPRFCLYASKWRHNDATSVQVEYIVNDVFVTGWLVKG